MHVLKSDEEDGVATLTVTIAGDRHRFEIWEEDGTAYVEYRESLSWRGAVEVSDPDDVVYRRLMTSEQVTEFLEANDCSSVKRSGRPAGD